MRNRLKKLWRVITFPFVLVFKLILLPFQAPFRAWEFLNSEPDETSEKTLVDHLEDFRTHLFWILAIIALAVGVSFYFTIPLMEYLATPIGGLAKLQAIEVTEEIGVYMRVALTSGLTISIPFTVFGLWRFAALGLKSSEKKFSLLAIPVATILFAGGVFTTHRVLIPAALPFLGGFTEIAQFWTAKEYFGFITGLMLWIGLFFETPLVIFVLTYLGIIQPRVLLEQWRLAVVVIAILAAAVTPTVDPVNMGLVMLPMTLLYFFSILMSYGAAGLRRRNAEAAKNDEEYGSGTPIE